jgi:hypothetical protein
MIKKFISEEANLIPQTRYNIKEGDGGGMKNQSPVWSFKDLTWPLRLAAAG